jgi:hypothetical protein
MPCPCSQLLSVAYELKVPMSENSYLMAVRWLLWEGRYSEIPPLVDQMKVHGRGSRCLAFL